MEDPTLEDALGSWARTRTADTTAATMVGGATTGGGAVTAGVEGIGAGDTVMAGDGAGDLALGGLIGVGDGDIRIPTTAQAITRPTRIILTRTTVLRTIHRAIRILTTGAAIPQRQILAHGHSPTRTDRQDPGDRRCREAERIQTTQTTTSRPLRSMGRFYPLTG